MASWGPLGIMSDSLGPLGLSLGPYWAVLGSCEAVSGPAWAFFGALLGCLGLLASPPRPLATLWGHLFLYLAAPGAMCKELAGQES